MMLNVGACLACPLGEALFFLHFCTRAGSGSMFPPLLPACYVIFEAFLLFCSRKVIPQSTRSSEQQVTCVFCVVIYASPEERFVRLF